MKLQELKESEENILEEGVMQDIFNYLWTATGKMLDKMPVIGDKRKEDRILKHYDNFVAKMDDKTTDKWIKDLTSELKSTHHASVKASERHASMLKSQIERVKKSKNARQYVDRMENMRRTLNGLKKFIKQSNKSAAGRKRKAAKAAKAAKAGA